MLTGVFSLAVTVGIFLSLAVLLLVAERYLADYGSCVVSINEGSVEFEQPGGGTLLSALYDHKIFIPSACGGKGSCGYCKVTVLRGGGPLLPTETPYIRRAEAKAGVRLACQIKIKEDLELKLREELLNVKEFKARVTSIRELTHDIKEVNLELLEHEEIKQRSGQYVQILAPGPDGPVFRAYSISSPPHEADKVQLIVRLVPGGIASTYIHGLREGDEVVFTGPFGEFRLSEESDKPVILVGGGAGMAPISNIIRTVYRRWPQRPCYLFFGCRTTRDVFYRDEFRKLSKEHPSFKVVYALSDPLAEEEQWDGETGFIHLSVDKLLPPAPNRQAFLCGPPPMIEAVTEVLAKKGFRTEDIFYDKF
jgi:Na+-transporting NADH:ubiquinone oxidoreductase subunit F